MAFILWLILLFIAPPIALIIAGIWLIFLVIGKFWPVLEGLHWAIFKKNK